MGKAVHILGLKGGAGVTLHQEIENNPVAKVIIYELIDRKKNVTKLERLRNWTSVALLLLLAALLFLGLDSAQVGILGLPFQLTTYGIYIVVGVVIILIRLLHLQKKAEKADNDFEELRGELIERAEELWKQDEGWQKRKLVFQHVLTDYGINLYYR
ncbi:DUF2663 family protein [Alkalicoccobacillus porphyridii]|uniref:DUF2663 family protein n=1 Tax=Alkalicoccobacillus porphyridii TaxID=2597270 RepID=A0A553ZZK6_9BACI|nr:DUF2663 family protein [Alkalicoccobacillus porphyridii]